MFFPSWLDGKPAAANRRLALAERVPGIVAQQGDVQFKAE